MGTVIHRISVIMAIKNLAGTGMGRDGITGTIPVGTGGPASHVTSRTRITPLPTSRVRCVRRPTCILLRGVGEG
jgi:hypothetical protein